MARKKTITRENILDSAFDLVMEEGFSNFTARSLAKYMRCSTQPIYLEFSCMGDLKNTVLKKVQLYLETKYYSQHYDEDGLINIFLAHIELARTNRSLYQAIFVDDHFGVDAMREFIYHIAEKQMLEDKNMKALSEACRHKIILNCWITATGIATLYSARYIDLTRPQMVQIIENQIKHVYQQSEVDTPVVS